MGFEPVATRDKAALDGGNLYSERVGHRTTRYAKRRYLPEVADETGLW